MNNEFIKYKTAITSLIEDQEFQSYKTAIKKYNKIIFIGNGGSNSITSHISQDFVKFHGKKALCMSDSSMITCFANDFGVESMYSEYLKIFSDQDTLCIIISSSGESKNILNCIKYCEDMKIPYGLLTGFNFDNSANSISKNALWRYYVNSSDYGVVECTHQIFLHGAV